MQQYNHTTEQEMMLEDSIKQLELVNKKLAKLIVLKEELTGLIIGALQHEHAGQRTYEYNEWKIEVKTPLTFSLDKKKYESGLFKLPSEFNPIKQSISYSIDKKLCDKFMMEAPKKVRETLTELIDTKPGKASISIKARV